MTYAAVEPGRLKEGALRGQQGQTAPVVDTSLQRCVVQARFWVVLVPVTRNRSHLGFLPRRGWPPRHLSLPGHLLTAAWDFSTVVQSSEPGLCFISVRPDRHIFILGPLRQIM